jgi:hypothetical protein
MKSVLRASLFAITLLALSIHGWSQATTGTISGMVTDPSGAVLPGTSLVLLNEETGISRTVQTDGGGRFNAPGLGVGRYKVTATLEGFQSEARTGIELSVSRTAVVNFQLQVGSVATTVEVTGEAPLVETTKGSLGTLVEAQAIQDLPLNGRDIAQLITLQTGAVEYTGASSEGGKLLVVSGGRPTTNVFNIDGVSIESFTQKTPTGRSGSFLGAEAVREFRVETNSYSAEYGRGTGGIFNVVTKSGTNAFHGSLFETLRNDNFDATAWNTNKLGLKKPEFKRNQFGGSLGGPIKRDQTFFFGTYEGYRQRLGITHPLRTFGPGLRRNQLPNGNPVVPANGPGARNADGIRSEIVPYLELWPLPNGPIASDGTGQYNYNSSEPTDENLYQVRVDHKLSDNDNIFGRYTLLNSHQERTADGDGFPGDGTSDRVRNQYSTFEWTRILTPSILNTFRAGYNRNAPFNQTQQAPINPALYFVPSSGQLGDLSVSGVNGVGEGVTGEYRVLNSIQLIDDVNWTKGRNSMKFGFNLNNLRFNGWNPARDAANYSFNSIPNFFNAVVQRFRGAVAPGFNDAYRSFRQNIIAMYFQDDLRVSPRLTLNLGLRYEFITVPKEVYGRIANFKGDINYMRTPTTSGVLGLTTGNPWFDNPSLKNFAPRVGFAWDVTGDAHTVLRGGAGLFFMNFDQTWIRTAGFRVPPFLVEVEATQNVPFPNMAALCSIQSPLITAGNPCPGRAAPDTVEEKWNSPYVAQYNLNIQRQLDASTVVTVGYAGSRGIRLPGVADTNGYDPVEENGRLAYSSAFFTRNGSGVLVIAPTVTRPNPNFDLIRLRYPGMNSWYNSLQVNLNRKFSKGLQLGAAYTFSKNLDEISGIQTASDTDSGPNSIPSYPRHDIYKGRSSFDATNVFTLNSSYELPIGEGKAIGGSVGRLGNAIIGGWQVSGIMTLASGFTSTIASAARFATLGHGNESPDLAPGASNNPTSGTAAGCAMFPGTAGEKLGTPELYYDPCAFLPPPERTIGNLGRNTIIMPGRALVDLSLAKNFGITETTKVEFRADAFNIFNHTNLGGPDRNVFTFSNSGNAFNGLNGSSGFLPAGTPGEINSIQGTARQIQLGLKLTF